jgi:hypothetical protein
MAIADSATSLKAAIRQTENVALDDEVEVVIWVATQGGAN